MKSSASRPPLGQMPPTVRREFTVFTVVSSHVIDWGSSVCAPAVLSRLRVPADGKEEGTPLR